MKTSNLQNCLLKGFQDHSKALLVFIFMSIVFITATLEIFAQQQIDRRYQIALKSRTFLPAARISQDTIQMIQSNLNRIKADPLLSRVGKIHFLVQLERIPSRRDKEDIKRYGIQFLDYIPNNTWIIAASGDISNAISKLNRYGLRWVGRLTPDDKSSAEIREGRLKVVEGNKTVILVQFHRTVPLEICRNIVQSHGGVINREVVTINSLIITISINNIPSLLNEDFVISAEQASPPLTGTNDGIRAATNVDDVQATPYNLDGTGVNVLVFDGGLVDNNHPDFGGRVTHGEASVNWDGEIVTVQDHPTHVAGTLGGDGGESAGQGGAVNQWRGMAPAVNIFSYGNDWDGTDLFLYDNLGDLEADFKEALLTHNVDIATASVGTNLALNHNADPVIFSCDKEGNYGATAQLIDNIVKGTLGRPLITTWAAGNERGPGTCGNQYNTIPPPAGAKNPITIGASNSNNNTMTGFSSWGPTDDGRLKPVVVAPGSQSNGDNGITSTVPNLFINNSINRNCAPGVPSPVPNTPNTDGDDHCYPYSVMSGTSMATPATAGIIALILQQYWDTYNTDDNPLPSTIKALLIHTAQDLGNPGPDFRFGYGLVDAQAAIDLIRNNQPQIFESQINEDDEINTYKVNVTGNPAEFNVSLAWDDEPGTNLGATELQNDLDLSLEDPNGTVHRPWVLDHTAGHEGDNAVTGIDNLNNMEQVHVDNPVAGFWKIRVTGEVVPKPIQKYSLVSDFPLAQQKNISVVQVIDRTGSMSYREDTGLPTYMESAKVSAQNFLSLMQIGDEAGIIGFDDPDCDWHDGTAESLFNIQELSTEGIRANAIASIDPLYARGCTSIAAGLNLAQFGPNFLDDANADNPHAIVLLSDGFENTTPNVSDILPSIPIKTDIYTIALGPWADATLLRNIADQTGGKYYVSPTILGLLSIYYQIQGELELGAMADMSVGVKESGNETKKVQVDAGSKLATFVVGWLQNEGSMNITLKDPGGNEINENQTGVSKGGSANSTYWRINNPLSGEWEVHIVRSDNYSGPLNYTFAAFINNNSKTWSYIPSIEDAGNCLLTKVYLYDEKSLQPIKGATVEAIVTSPETSVYTLHYNFVKPSTPTWKAVKYFSPSLKAITGSLAETTEEKLPTFALTLNKYDAESIKTTGKSIFQYNTKTYRLYDDGTTGDEVANDGYYTYCIPNTEIAGSYSISFRITGVSASGSRFTRTLLSSSVLAPARVDPSKVFVRIDPKEIELKEGSEGIISIVPIDKFGNLLGPGNASRISVSVDAGQLSGKVVDNGDGFYFTKIISTGTEQSGTVTVKVDGIEANLKPKFAISVPFKRFSLSLHTGSAIPVSTLADTFNIGYNAIFNAGYSFSRYLSLVAYFGYNNFKSKITGVNDNYRLNLSLNIKYRRLFPRLPNNNWYYYVQAGPGYYIPKYGDNGFGANAGFGFDYDFKPYITFEVGTDYHFVFDQDVKFLHAHAGLIFRF